MYHGKYENQSNPVSRKPSRMTWVLVIAALLTSVLGGVSAYLSLSSGDLPNKFQTAPQPVVTVTDTTVTVNPNGYAVYLRVAVDANWKNGDIIRPEEPTLTFTEGNQWKEIDGFYYYRSVIQGSNTQEVSVPVTASAKDGCTLEITVAAQVIQAVGQTDTGNVDAVMDAWGIPKETIIGN